MAKYAVSGSSGSALTPATASTMVAVISALAIPSGKGFWLRSLWVSPYDATSNTGRVVLSDATVGATVTGATSSMLMVTVPRTVADGQTGQASVINFNAPGIKFATNAVASLEVTGTFPAGLIGAAGYYE